MTPREVPLFDVFVMADWSASVTPTRGPDSIWVATLDAISGSLDVVNHPTRAAARRSMRHELTTRADRRVLVGLDLPLAYPERTAAALCATRPVAASAFGVGTSVAPWRAMWDLLVAEITDDDRNRNNRFEVASRLNALVGPGPGPFWGCPPGRATDHLHTHKVHRFPVDGPAGPLAEFRRCENSLIAEGRRPFSLWQTAYAGSVGGQALVGIPVVARLVDDPALVSRSHVWPFTTGLGPDPTAGRRDAIVWAEVWPSAFDVDRSRHGVKDAAQVIAACEWFAAADRDGRLPGWFDPPIDPADLETVVSEEGWVLGVTPVS